MDQRCACMCLGACAWQYVIGFVQLHVHAHAVCCAVIYLLRINNANKDGLSLIGMLSLITTWCSQAWHIDLHFCAVAVVVQTLVQSLCVQVPARLAASQSARDSWVVGVPGSFVLDRPFSSVGCSLLLATRQSRRKNASRCKLWSSLKPANDLIQHRPHFFRTRRTHPAGPAAGQARKTKVALAKLHRWKCLVSLG